MKTLNRKCSGVLIIAVAFVLVGTAPATPTATGHSTDAAQEELHDRQEARADELLELARQDIAAQNAMAHWTRVMSIAAICGLALSSIGIGLVFVTFQQTRKAAKSAADTHKAFVAAERPQLTVCVANCRRQSQHLLGRLSVSNIGRSTASITHLAYDVVYDADFVFHPMFHRTYNQIVSAGESYDLVENFQLNAPNEGNVFVRGYVLYSSPFGQQHRSNFAAQLFPTDPNNAMVESALYYGSQLDPVKWLGINS